MTTFDGFPEDSLRFFDEIVANNERGWFETNKPRFQESVQRPAQAFVEALGAQLKTLVPNIRYDTKLNGSGSIMRIYRDVRFSRDKSPYKTNLGIVWWQGAGKKTQCPGFYFHLEADSIWMGCGLYQLPDLDRYRRAVDREESGEALVEIEKDLAAQSMPFNGERYKRVPRGYDKAHPRADLLKLKGLTVLSPEIPATIVTSPELQAVCFDFCQKTLPLHQWLVTHVG